MLRFGKTNLAKKLNIWNADVDNIVISKLIEKKKNNSKYLIKYVNDVIRPLVLILPKVNGYGK